VKDEALALVATSQDPGQKLNLLREYLQAFVLRSLSESEAFSQLSFVGGTALRFLHGLPRFSEDLDFSLERTAGYEPIKWLDKLKRDLALSGFVAELRWDDRRVVHSAWIRFSGLLQEAGLTPAPNQKLSIKLEIDSRPPSGAILIKSVVNRHMLFVLQYHDLPSLMSGKIHALITRSYTKGRDWYDLLWYRSRRPPVEPNLMLLENALRQTQETAVDAGPWQRQVLEKLATIDEQQMIDDVRPFLERAEDLRLMKRAHLEGLL